MALRFDAVTFSVGDVATTAAFWAALLDREIHAEPDAAFLPGDDVQVGLRFVSADAPVGPDRLHLHLTSDSPDRQRRTVETALGLGARHVDVGQRPEEPHVVLADPGGNHLCVIGAGNNFLAGTGFLGEVTCDGSRAVGYFWRDALGWALVWDHEQQTAIQSPRGGTKISWDAWDGPPPAPGTVAQRQRFDLVADDPIAEAERLVLLGATRRSELPRGIELADPDGNTFLLRRG